MNPSKRRLSTTTSISLGFACIIFAAALSAHYLGLIPDPTTVKAQQRTAIARVAALECANAAHDQNLNALRAALSQVAAQHPRDVRSIGLRTPDHKLALSVGSHPQSWQNAAPSLDAVQLPVIVNGQPWAFLEITFVPVPSGLTAVTTDPIVRLGLFLSILGFIGSKLFLHRVLKHLDPSQVVPQRVRAMLDALAEGVVVLDDQQQIVLANSTFCDTVHLPLLHLQGKEISMLRFQNDDPTDTAGMLPWARCAAEKRPILRVPVTLTLRIEGARHTRQFMVNATPINGTGGQQRGVLVNFDDVTTIESAKDRLEQALADIENKNQELSIMASHDPLTACLNRRSFYEELTHYWKAGQPLACLMIDIDHFKKINDTFGHGVGDKVLAATADVLRDTVGLDAVVGRYGGEEFCILIPGRNTITTLDIAQRINANIRKHRWPVPRVTVSIGLSCREQPAVSSAEKLMQDADRHLYLAKQSGRDRTVSPLNMPAQIPA